MLNGSVRRPQVYLETFLLADLLDRIAGGDSILRARASALFSKRAELILGLETIVELLSYQTPGAAERRWVLLRELAWTRTLSTTPDGNEGPASVQSVLVASDVARHVGRPEYGPYSLGPEKQARFFGLSWQDAHALALYLKEQQHERSFLQKKDINLPEFKPGLRVDVPRASLDMQRRSSRALAGSTSKRSGLEPKTVSRLEAKWGAATAAMPGLGRRTFHEEVDLVRELHRIQGVHFDEVLFRRSGGMSNFGLERIFYQAADTIFDYRWNPIVPELLAIDARDIRLADMVSFKTQVGALDALGGSSKGDFVDSLGVAMSTLVDLVIVDRSAHTKIVAAKARAEPLLDKLELERVVHVATLEQAMNITEGSG